ncbi:hypothetical protein BGW38_009770 [Lunasporangiospora selenospora]|uniref:Uncharacterized protein n=1 Tax=Lunasporangiospora selenospora TaxID=979761 RepID=A0A9P6F6S3_9FUNG|nr:hypothetical protein BGW38_009770 [Lunasporangiospora selenospora]
MQLTPHGGQKAFAGGLYITPLSQPGGGPVAHRPERSMDGRIRISRHLEEWALPKIHHHDMTTASSTAMTTSTATLASGQLGVLDEGVEESTETLASATPKRKPSLGISIASGGGGGLGDRAWTPTMGKRIGVDQLKAALATAAQSHSSVDGASETASSTAGSETRGTTSSPHRSGYLHPAYAHSATLARGGGGGGASKQQLMTMAQPSSLASSRPDLADLLNTIQVSAPSTNQSNVSLVTPPY